MTRKTLDRMLADPRAGWDALTDALGFALFIGAMMLALGWLL